MGIRELAQHLQISIGTVSRALNGRPDVNAETRAKVLAAAAQLGYAPNQSGRALRNGKTGLVGLVVRRQPGGAEEGSVFLMGVIEGIQTVLSGHGLDLVALLCPPHEDQDEFLRRIVARGFADGIILADTRRDDPRVSMLKSAKVPFVLLGRSAPDPDCAWVDADVDLMAHQAADRLVGKGHRSFATFAADDGDYFYENFRIEFDRRLAHHGLDGGRHYTGTPTEQGGYDLTAELLQSGATPAAIVLLSEFMTLGVYRALLESNRRPGKDIALIGRDNTQAQFLYPALTRFRLPLRDVGESIARGLTLGLAGQSAEGAFQKLWPMELIEGDSD